MMNIEQNKRTVTANDNGIKCQVPGITTKKEKAEKPSEIRDQELFYRAIGR